MKRYVIGVLAVAALLAGAVLTVPAAALAQGAGDEQYQDPFSGDEGGSQESPAPEPAEPPAADPAPVEPAPSESVERDAGPAAPTEDPTTGAPVDPSGTTAETLPRTGSEAVLPAALGLALLAVGTLMRRRLACSRAQL